MSASNFDDARRQLDAEQRRRIADTLICPGAGCQEQNLPRRSPLITIDERWVASCDKCGHLWPVPRESPHAG